MLIIATIDMDFFRDVASLVLNFTALVIILDFDNLLMDSYFFKRYKLKNEKQTDLFELEYPKREATTIATLAQIDPKRFSGGYLSKVNWVWIVIALGVIVNI